MSDLTDKLDAVKQEVSELEAQMRGASPLQAKISKDQADLEELAKTVEASLTAMNEREKNLTERETNLVSREQVIADREAKFEEAKAALKASQKK